MKTNYSNLDKFEVASVAVIAVGVALIGLEFFAGMSHTNQQKVTSAFGIFDMHQQFAQVSQTAGQIFQDTNFVYNTAQDFYNQFDLAFTQTFSYPDTIGTPLIKLADSMNNYAYSVAQSYGDSVALQQTTNGKVLGAAFTQVYTDTSAPVSAATDDDTIAPVNNTLIMPYQYISPSQIKNLFQK